MLLLQQTKHQHPLEAADLETLLNSALIQLTSLNNKTNWSTVENERFINQKTKLTDTSTVSRLAKAWDGFVDLQKLAAQHAMDSVTRSTICELTSQEQQMEKEADGSVTVRPALTD